MDIHIRKAEPEDTEAVVGLLYRFAEFEKLLDFCEVTVERLNAAMFSSEAYVEGLIAFDGSEPIGYSIFYKNFSSFRGQRGIYLEDIYVEAAYRGKGVGERMLREIARLARSRGFERIDFQVLEWNTPAARFYEKLGAHRDEDERHFKFTDAAFDELAS